MECDGMNSRKWNIPLTYEPKISAVIAGTCTQTIRTGRKFNEGDLIRFYTWQGRPYRSFRTTITGYMKISKAIQCKIYIFGIWISSEYKLPTAGLCIWGDLNWLAARDGIVPPTGEALRDVLIAKNGKIPYEGIDAQIVRWFP